MHRCRCTRSLVLAVALICLPGFGFSAPVSIGSLQIELPAPQDSVEINEQLPTFRKVMDSVIPESHRLVALYAPESEVKQAVLTGNVINHYMMVQVLRAIENMDISPSDFDSVVALTKAQLPSLEKVMTDAANSAVQKATDTVAEETKIKVDLKIGESKILGVYADEKDWIGLSLKMATQVGVAGKDATTRTLICAANTVRVRNRILYLFVYADYDSDADKAYTEATSRSWIKATWAANAEPVKPAADKS